MLPKGNASASLSLWMMYVMKHITEHTAVAKTKKRLLLKGSGFLNQRRHEGDITGIKGASSDNDN